MHMAFIPQEGQGAEEKNPNYGSPDLQPQELMGPERIWVSELSLKVLEDGEELQFWEESVKDGFVLTEINAFSVATVKKLDYQILAGKLKLGKNSHGRYFSGFNWALTHKRLRTKFWASILKQLFTSHSFLQKGIQASKEGWITFTHSLWCYALSLVPQTKLQF